MNRREFLKSSATTVGTIALATSASASLTACGDSMDAQVTAGAQLKAKSASGQVAWNNWSELQACHPKEIVSPTNELELAQAVRGATGVRAVGSGHSFSPLVPTDQTIISLDALAGVVDYDAAKLTATVHAGTKLSQLIRDLDAIGQVTYNLPDVVYQSLAGAISTGTHGTGRNLSALHHYVTQLKLMTADGNIMTCNRTENSDVFDAARVSIGSLGIITEATLQNRATYKLHRKMWVKPLDYVLANAAQLFEQHEHFELIYLPHTKFCVLTSHDPTDEALKPRGASADDEGLADLKKLRDLVPASLRQYLIRFIIKDNEVMEDATDQAWRLLAQSRPSKFNESEYHIPKEKGLECFAQVCAKMDTIGEAYYPIEFRVTKADDAWLSPFYQSDRHSIAVHANNVENYEYLISQIGPIFKAFNGRPHWGKLNDLGYKELFELYPRYQDFLKVRAQLDPKGKFLNDYTRKIFNVT